MKNTRRKGVKGISNISKKCVKHRCHKYVRKMSKIFQKNVKNMLTVCQTDGKSMETRKFKNRRIVVVAVVKPGLKFIQGHIH